MNHKGLFAFFFMALIALPVACLAQEDEEQLKNGVAIQELTEERSGSPESMLSIPYGGDHQGVVTAVIDAARIVIDGEEMELVGIAAPQRNADGTARDCFSHESATYVESRILGKRVSYSLEKQDGHEQRLGAQRIYLYIGSSMLNSEFVRRGMALADRRPGYPEEDAFVELQQEASRGHLGLWHSCPVECDRFGDCMTKGW